VRDILTDPGRLQHDRGNARRHLLSGFVVCGNCRKPMCAGPQGGTGRNKKPRYKCRATPEGCGAGSRIWPCTAKKQPQRAGSKRTPARPPTVPPDHPRPAAKRSAERIGTTTPSARGYHLDGRSAPRWTAVAIITEGGIPARLALRPPRSVLPQPGQRKTYQTDRRMAPGSC
jgi:hypothetical protein